MIFGQLPTVLGFDAVEACAYALVQVFRYVSGVVVVMIMIMIGITMVVVMSFTHVATGQQTDVVAEMAVKNPNAAFVHAIVEAQGQVAGNRFFFAQVWIADFISTGRDVSAVGVQLVERWRTFGVTQRCCQRPDWRQFINHTGR
ncbi:hypothetical protein D3C77_539540 [compost metagenome]